MQTIVSKPKIFIRSCCHDGLVKKPSKKNLVKKTNQKDPIKMVRLKTTCPKWHFGQVGHKRKKTIWGFSLLKLLIKKATISCSVKHNTNNINFGSYN